MKTYLISLCHTNPTVIFAGLSNLEASMETKPTEKILVDHQYPLKHWETKESLVRIAKVFNFKLIAPLKNLGAHHGFNWALKQIDLQPEDIVFGVDPDCNIVTPGWDKAMIQVFTAQPRIGSLSLLLDAIVPHNQSNWAIDTINGIKVGFLNKPEMFNVTGWKGEFLLASGGLKALMGFYGHVEVAMRHEAQTHHFRQGYLMDYRETFNLVPHDEEYNKWKGLHVGGYKKNFGEYLKENGIN